MSLNSYGLYVSDIAPQQAVVPDATGGSGSGSNFAGSGSPEGVVTADVSGGTTSYFYWDYANKQEYVKDSGAGNTGWIPLVG